MRRLVPLIGCALATALCLSLISISPGSLEAASPSPIQKPYCPFDESKPRLPKEIDSDARLDRKVEVFVKDKNLEQLFDELTDKTGVNLRVAREIRGERVIVCFRSRPLRDLMVELSHLTGYHWLATPDKGEYRYEIFEDIRHSKRRDELKQMEQSAQTAFLCQLSANTASDNPDLARQRDSAIGRGEFDSIASLVNDLGPDSLGMILARLPVTIHLRDLNPDTRAAILAWLNEKIKSGWAPIPGEPVDGTNPDLLTPEDMTSADLVIKRVTQRPSGFPQLDLALDSPAAVDRSIQWPPWSVPESSLWRVACGSEAEQVIGREDLPDVKITRAVDRRIFSREMDALVIGDILEAIARQAKIDVIADYYYQEAFFQRGCTDEPLDSVISRICKDANYTCQVDGGILRFRYNKWYQQQPLDEPAAGLVEGYWRKIETVGCLDLNDLLDIAALSDLQAIWPGFRFMPGARTVRLMPAGLKLWGLLRPSAESQARSPEGVPVWRLNREQFGQLCVWARAMKVDPVSSDLTQGAIRITEEQNNPGADGSSGTASPRPPAWKLELVMPDGASYPTGLRLPEPLSAEDRKRLSSQRRRDADADVISVER